MSYGLCNLTQQKGKFVRSHLLPRALTKSPTPGEPRIEAGLGPRPVKRYDSWFDNQLVTRAGENILEKYDDWAIKELRNLKLVYSSWGDSVVLPSDDVDWFGETEFGWRVVQSSDSAKLRLFFLSLLWRAANSTLAGYRLHIDEERNETLRLMVLTGNPEPWSFFPVTLIQLSTKGRWQVVGPRTEWKTYPDDDTETRVKYHRFYLDGLIVHFDEETTDQFPDRWGNLAVGLQADTSVMVRPYEDSYQERWIEDMIFRQHRDHPLIVEKILGR